MKYFLNKLIGNTSLITTLLILIGGNKIICQKTITYTTNSNKALKEFNIGLNLFHNLKGHEALSHFHEAVKYDSGFALANAFLGRTHHNNSSRRDYLSKAIEQSVNSTEGERLLISAFHAFYVEDNPNKEFYYYKEFAQKYPQDVQARYFLGYASKVHGRRDFELSIKELKKAIELDSGFVAAYNDLGYTYISLGNYEAAKGVFERYIDLVPNEINAYDSYGEVLLKMGNYKKSIKAYNKALDIDSTFFWSNLGVAAAFRSIGKFEKARDYLNDLPDKAVNNRERNHAIRALLVSYIEEGEWEKAEENTAQLFNWAESKNDTSSMYNILSYAGHILLESKKFNEARKKYQRAANLIDVSSFSSSTKRNVKLSFNYRITKLELAANNFDKADKYFEKFEDGILKTENNQNANLINELRGLFALCKGEFEKALKEFLSTDNRVMSNLFHIAETYKALGDRSNAQKYCERILGFNSLNDLNHALVKRKANKMLKGL